MCFTILRSMVAARGERSLLTRDRGEGLTSPGKGRSRMTDLPISEIVQSVIDDLERASIITVEDEKARKERLRNEHTHTLVAWTLDPCRWTKGHWVLTVDLRSPGPAKTLCGVMVPLVVFNREEGHWADQLGICKRCERSRGRREI